jgi:hypothetical protein
VDLLVSNGNVAQADSDRLRKLGDMRNALTHGQINVRPTSDDVLYLLELEEGLVS